MSKRRRWLATVVALLAGSQLFAGEKESAMTAPVSITVTDETLHAVDSDLFGQFLEKPSWGGETGPEAAVLPNTGNLDPRVVEMLARMDIPVVRFPGGTDVDHLDWRDMVTDARGPDSGRPDSKGRWDQAITNAFGYDEYFQLAEELGWQSILVVNLRDGLLTDKTPEQAAQHAAALLAYCTGTEDAVPAHLKAWPALRAANGHPEPYAVEYVQIGNETWFWTKAMKEKHGEERWVGAWCDAIETFIAAVRAVKPGVRIISDGHPLEIAAELHRRQVGVDLYALHRYYTMGIKRVQTPDGEAADLAQVTPRQAWNTLIHSTETDAQGLALWQDSSIDQARELGYALAMTEWNLNSWWQMKEGRELFPGSGACGLGAAVMLNAMLRRGETVRLATQSMLVGQSWGITGIRVYPDPPGRAPHYLPTAEVTTLYNRHHGDRRLGVAYETEPPLWQAEIYFGKAGHPCKQAALVDVVATRSDRTLYLHALNTDYDQDHPVTVTLAGFADLPAHATVHALRLHTREEKEAVGVWVSRRQSQADLDGQRLTLTLPRRSASAVVVELP